MCVVSKSDNGSQLWQCMLSSYKAASTMVASGEFGTLMRCTQFMIYMHVLIICVLYHLILCMTIYTRANAPALRDFGHPDLKSWSADQVLMFWFHRSDLSSTTGPAGPVEHAHEWLSQWANCPWTGTALSPQPIYACATQLCLWL